MLLGYALEELLLGRAGADVLQGCCRHLFESPGDRVKIQVAIVDPESFVGAVVDAAPDKLEEAIRLQDGLRFSVIGGSARFPVKEANTGTRIVFANNRAKIFCAKFKPLPPALR